MIKCGVSELGVRHGYVLVVTVVFVKKFHSFGLDNSAGSWDGFLNLWIVII